MVEMEGWGVRKGGGEREGEGGRDAGDYKTWTLDWAATLPKTGAC